MYIAEGMPICLASQAAVGGATARPAGRVAEITGGVVRIRIFDERIKTWVYPRVKQSMLRRCNDRVLAALEQFERTYPVTPLEGNSLSGSSTELTQCSTPAAANGVSLVRVEVRVRQDDADLVLEIARALADPDDAHGARTQLRSHFGSNADLLSELRKKPEPGQFNGRPDPELDVRIAYRALVMRDRCVTLARWAGTTGDSVRRRVSRGVERALDYAADPALEPYRFESLSVLRRGASVLQPVLERVFLHFRQQTRTGGATCRTLSVGQLLTSAALTRTPASQTLAEADGSFSSGGREPSGRRTKK